jgi:hypothetical protein
MHASEPELDDALARLPGSVAGAIVERRCPAAAEPGSWDLAGVVEDMSDIAGLSASRRRHLKDVRASHGDRSLLVRILADAFTRATEVRRSELGVSLLAQVTRHVALRVLGVRWRIEVRRLLDELAELWSLPQAELGPAVAAVRWAAPADIDLDHELVARDVLSYVLQVKVEPG